jgi:polar amino acid transport system permease protein
VFGLVAWWISNSEFWPAVQRQFFSWTAIEESFPSVLRGFWLNLQVWIIAEVFILVFALVRRQWPDSALQLLIIHHKKERKNVYS